MTDKLTAIELKVRLHRTTHEHAMTDTKDAAIQKSSDLEVNALDNLKPEEGTIVAPDRFDSQYQTTRREIWSYYSCVQITWLIILIWSAAKKWVAIQLLHRQ
jgi:hypothetical protein